MLMGPPESAMIQVRPVTIPAAYGSQEYEFVPVNLPQLELDARFRRMVRSPSSPVSISNSPGASINIASTVGMKGLSDGMLQVRPNMIPSATGVPIEYTPVNLPQLMMSLRQPGRQFVKEPRPTIEISAGNNSPGASINITSNLKGLDDDAMMQVFPIPSASGSPTDYVPVNLPQLVLSMGQSRRQLVREPKPAIAISAGGSVNISSGSSMNFGSGLSGIGDASDKNLLAGVIVFGILILLTKRR